MILQSSIISRVHALLKTPSISPSPIVTETAASRAREALADTVAPFRWSDAQLAEFAGDGAAEIANLRSDVRTMGVTPAEFTSALANYIVYRALALDNDAQNNNGALSDKYYQVFASQTMAVRFFYTMEMLAGFADETVADLTAKRPELRLTNNGNALKENIRIVSGDSVLYDLPDRFADAVVYGTAGRAAVQGNDDNAKYYSEQYQGALNTI